MAEAAASSSLRFVDVASSLEEGLVVPELEDSARREGRLSHFVAEPQSRRGSSVPIPAVDPQALRDVARLAAQVAAQVEALLRTLHGALQSLTTLSVGCIQTYRDGVEGLGEAVDSGVRSMYALMARCEELDAELRPVPALAERIRHMKGALETLERLCK